MRMDADAVDALEHIYSFIDTLTGKDDQIRFVLSRRDLRLHARAHMTQTCHLQAQRERAMAAAEAQAPEEGEGTP